MGDEHKMAIYKSDLAQKLLHDLRLRKQQLADNVGALNAGDASGNQGHTNEKSRNTNTSEIDGNDVVPPKSGHQLSQTKGFCTTLTYALDDGCQPKSARFLSKGTLMGFFHQTKDISLQQSPNKQLPPTNELPTITNLEIKDITKETKKLRQILKVRSFSLDFDKGSKEIGSELWRGAMELEQSLKLLANMQELPKKSSHKKADGDGDEDEDEDDDLIISEKQTQVENPVFSFDKASKNRKGSIENEPTPMLVDSTCVNGAPNPDSRPEKQVSVTSKSTSKLSTNKDSEFQSSQHTNSSNLKHNTGKIPNVIAKLMGLEELRKEINKKITTEREITSKPRSDAVVSTNDAYKSLLSFQAKTKYVKNAETRIQNVVQSNKITIMKPLESKGGEKEREAVKNNGLVVSKEAIFKINELRSKITEMKHYNTRPKDCRNAIGATRQKVRAMDDIKRLKTTEVKRQKSEGVDEHRVQELKHCDGYERKKRAMTKPIIQQKLIKETQSQHQKVLSKVRSQQIFNKTKMEIPEGRSILKKPPNVKADVHNLLKKAKENALATSEASKRHERRVKPERNSTSTQVSEVQARVSKLVHESAKKVVNDTKSEKKHSQLAKNRSMSQNVKTTNKIAFLKGTQRSSVSEGSQKNGILSKPTKKIPENIKSSTPASQQQVDVEQISTQNNGVEDETWRKEIVHDSPTNEKNQSKTISSIADLQTVPDEVQEVKSQRTTTDGCKDNINIPDDLQPTQIEKQTQLTEDEMHMKQMIITSNILLNTAEAIFKLKIPANIRKYTNNQNRQDKYSKLILDCSYEVLTRKGRNQEFLLYPHITTNTSHTMITTSLDDLVRQLHKDFETLKSYGRNENDEYDYTYVLNMIEKDMHNKDADLNSMWEFSWKDKVFACMEMVEVIIDVEKEVVEELVDEIVSDFMLSS